jgi:hypothetical protein
MAAINLRNPSLPFRNFRDSRSKNAFETHEPLSTPRNPEIFKLLFEKFLKLLFEKFQSHESLVWNTWTVNPCSHLVQLISEDDDIGDSQRYIYLFAAIIAFIAFIDLIRP